MSQETVQKTLSDDMASCWNKSNGFTVNTDITNAPKKLIPPGQFSSSNLKQAFNTMTKVLEDFDAPIISAPAQFISSSNPADILSMNQSALQPHEIRQVRPIAAVAGQTTLNKKVKPLSLDENIRINYQKRALSYFHGAVLTIDNNHALTQKQKIQALAALVDVYNRYKDGPTRNDFYAAKYEDFWGKKQGIYLRKMVIRMTLVLEDYGLNYKDLCAGEKVANLERPRPQIIQSEYTSEFKRQFTSTISVTETPITAQIDSKQFSTQYEFLHEFSSNHDYYRLSPKWFQKLDVDEQNTLITAYPKLVEHYHAETQKNHWEKRQELHDRLLMINSDIPLKHIMNIDDLDFIINLNYLKKVPRWFRELKPVIQEYLIEHRNDKNLPSIPATLRSIPLLANMNLHQGQFKANMAEKNYNVQNKVIRHGTLTPYEITNNEERKQATYANGRALADLMLPMAKENFKNFWAEGVMMTGDTLLPHRKIPIADLSFMSPFDVKKMEEKLQTATLKEQGLYQSIKATVFDARPKGKTFFDSNRSLRDENKAGFLHGIHEHGEGKYFNTMPTNLGINGDRWQISDTFNENEYQKTIGNASDTFEQFQRFVTFKKKDNQPEPYPFRSIEAKNKFDFASKSHTALLSMTKRFDKSFIETTLNPDSTDVELSKRINAELFANCLYAIMIEGMGGTISACCKSTKDRTGLFLLHLDAMHQYYAETGTLIAYDASEDSEERQRFVEIMATLFLSNMQQYMAGQTTFGAAGLKKPGGVLGNMSPIPTDLLAALKVKSPGLFERQKELANANKISFKMGLTPLLTKPMKTFENIKLFYFEKVLFYKDKMTAVVNKLFDDILNKTQDILDRIHPRYQASEKPRP